MSPDAAGNFKGIHVSAEAWERVFGPKPNYWCGCCGEEYWIRPASSQSPICYPCDAMLRPLIPNRDNSSARA